MVECSSTSSNLGEKSCISTDRTYMPLPPSELHVTTFNLPKGQILHRVHQRKYQPVQFNPGIQGNARFSPIRNEQGQPIPTLYVGTSFDCVFMLFGDRIDNMSLRQKANSQDILLDSHTYAEVLDLAERIGAYIVPGISPLIN